MKHIFFIAILLYFSLPLTAEQFVISNYNTARDTCFWDKLYKYGGWTLYCGSPFYAKGLGLTVSGNFDLLKALNGKGYFARLMEFIQ